MKPINRPLTIVMYHYVRDVEKTPFPNIKALGVQEFIGQLEYIRKHYRVISPDQLMTAIKDDSRRLPPNSLVLTFDDGYSDHFQTVFPILNAFGFKGIFSPVPRSVLEGRVLDVNKIHHILSATSDNIDRVVGEIFTLLDTFRTEFELESNEKLYDRLAIPNRFDPADVIFIKRILQRDLPEPLRNRIADILFEKYVSTDETSFAADLYMNMDQLVKMASQGMMIASHGYDHYWLDTLPPHRQDEQIQKSLEFLRQIHPTRSEWMMCYPYGAYNDQLLKIMTKYGFVAGLTTAVDLAKPGCNPLLLPRIDTNDLPKRGDAPIADWTLKAGSS